MINLTGKVLLVNGGTGSFGHAVVRKFLDTDIGEIRILSRDEKKQDDMRKHFNSSKLKFFIGDVRDYNSVLTATRGADFLFHAAALKQVPSCEFFPLEAVKTNIIGTENALEAAIACHLEKVVCLSTDKAVYPINAMGISKALMEKVAVAKSRSSGIKTTICCTRYGNVMASRGSVIPLFVKQIFQGAPISITDPNMTRFMMTLDEAVDLVLFAFEHGTPGDIFIQKSPAATIDVLAKSLVSIFDKNDHPIQKIGTRHGEKLFEVLMSREEVAVSTDLGAYYKIAPDLRDLNYDKFVEAGDLGISDAIEYTSHNTSRLTVEETKNLLLKLPFIVDAKNGLFVEPVD